MGTGNMAKKYKIRVQQLFHVRELLAKFSLVRGDCHVISWRA